MKIWKASFLAVCLAFAAQSNAGQLLFRKVGAEKYLNIAALKQEQNLILFWRSDCAPCLTEIGLLPEISRQFPHLKISLVSLQNKELPPQYLPSKLPNIRQIIAVSDAREVLQAFANEKSALPYSVALNKNGSICEKNYGILAISKIKKWIKICSISTM